MTIKDSAATSGADYTSKIAQGVDRAASGAHHKIDAAVDASGPAVNKAAQGAHATVDKVGEFASHAAEAIDHKADQLNEASGKFFKATGDYMQAHPVATIGIAVATGYVLSRMFSSR